jgi:hypothetical protein
MKLVGIISTGVLFLALAAAVPAYAQQDQHDQKQEEKAKPARQEAKPTQQHKPAKQEQKAAPQAENNATQNKPSAQKERANGREEKTAQQPHTTQRTQRSAGDRHGRIPDDRFRANFGRQHTFHVSQGEYRGHRFQYGGYSFGFIDPWPANWLYTQDVYVVDINGVYYLCNPMYPGVNVAISVVL